MRPLSHVHGEPFLKAAASSSPSGSPGAAVARIEDHSGRTVVVVDDNPKFLLLLRSMLRELGFTEIFDFTDPQEAFLFTTRVHVDVILVDLVMTPMNGFQLADRVRHADVVVNRVVPIILITGLAGQDNIRKAINHGIDEVLVKPLSVRHLHDRLLGVLDRPRVYIKTPSGYFGPDRRRRENPRYTGPERRRKAVAEVITHETLIEMREDTRRKYGKVRPSPLEPEELPPLLVGPILTIPVSVITTRDGPRAVARVPTPMRPLAEQAAAAAALPESATRPTLVVPENAVPIAPPPPPPPEPKPEEFHFLD